MNLSARKWLLLVLVSRCSEEAVHIEMILHVSDLDRGLSLCIGGAFESTGGLGY